MEINFDDFLYSVRYRYEMTMVKVETTNPTIFLSISTGTIIVFRLVLSDVEYDLNDVTSIDSKYFPTK